MKSPERTSRASPLALGAAAAVELCKSSVLASSTVVICAIVALLVSAGRIGDAVAIAFLPLVAVAAPSIGTRWKLLAERRIAAVMLLLLIASTLVWRIRGTGSLNENPLDGAAALRIGLVTIAGLIALRVLSVRARVPVSSAAVLLMGGYVAVTLVSAALSPLPLQAGFRTFELATGLLVVLACRNVVASSDELVLIVILGVTVLLAVTWAEAIAFPETGWLPVPNGVLGRQIVGHLPALASNTIGSFGALVALYGLVRRWPWLLAFGFVTMLAAQSRTSVVGFIAGVVVVLVMRRRVKVMVLVVGVVVALALFGRLAGVSTFASDAFQRGQQDRVFHSLTGRTEFWSAAVPYVEERPWLGWGMNVASREVLSNAGFDTTSTIHGAWMEALLGAGAVGATLLLLSLAAALIQSWRARDVFAVAAFTFIALRSVTGQSIELFGVLSVLFLVLAVRRESHTSYTPAEARDAMTQVGSS